MPDDSDRDRDPDSRATRLVKWLVRGWRRLDARFNRPAPEGRARLSTLLLPAGVVWYMPLLTLLAVAGMALGPVPRMGTPQVLLLVLGLAGILLVHLDAMRGIDRPRQGRFLGRLCLGYLLVLLALAILLGALAGAETYDEPGLQLHVGAAMVVAVTLGLALAAWFSSRLLRIAPAGALAATLAEVDLFSPRERYTDANGIVFPVAALVALMRYPDRILLPASLAMLFVSEATRDVLGRGWQGELWLFFGLTALTWLLMTLALIYERLLEILDTLGRVFFTGPQRLVTWLVIAMAILRLMQVHYVNYLFDGDNNIIILYVLLAYVVACFYGFWCDLLLARQLLHLLGGKQGADGPYRYQVCTRLETRGTGADMEAALAGPDSAISSVLAHGRSVALHGAGRFKIEGLHRQDYADAQRIDTRALAFLTAQELTTRLRTLAEERDSASSLMLVREVQRAAMIYPPLMAILAFVILGVPGYLGTVVAIQPAALEIRPAPADGSFNLTAALEGREHPASACEAPQPNAPRIALALSGGGTRAAMHGYAVLRGLAVDGQICNVVAVSGVSGGAAALGYFAAHQGELRTPVLDTRAWAAFGRAMSEPFIDDVLAEASSLRVAYGRYSWRRDACAEPGRPYARVMGWYPTARTRSGNILAEDFVCTFGTGAIDNLPFAAIFNTGLAGYFDTAEARCGAPADTLAGRAQSCAGQLDGSRTGDRLVLTNLPLLGGRNARGKEHEASWLVTLNQPGISLARAAALSANFPPVFPDSPIDVTADGRNGQRYWVSDGGTIENRGAVTLLLALNDALAAPKATLSGPLHVIVADASALDRNYSQSWGFRAVTGAGTRLASAMEAQLRDTLEQRLASLGEKLRYDELAMPPALVSVIGTHWRLPGQIVIGDPERYGQGIVGAIFRAIRSRKDGPATSVALRGQEIAALVECLYSRDITDIPGMNADKTAAALTIMAADDTDWKNGANWRGVETALGVPAPRAGMCGGLGPQ